jgi:hypothetical protein
MGESPESRLDTRISNSLESEAESSSGEISPVREHAFVNPTQPVQSSSMGTQPPYYGSRRNGISREDTIPAPYVPIPTPETSSAFMGSQLLPEFYLQPGLSFTHNNPMGMMPSSTHESSMTVLFNQDMPTAAHQTSHVNTFRSNSIVGQDDDEHELDFTNYSPNGERTRKMFGINPPSWRS